MTDNFNPLNIGMLLLGLLLVLSAVYDKKIADLIRAIASGDLSAFTAPPSINQPTAGSSGASGMNGGGGFGGGAGGSW